MAANIGLAWSDASRRGAKRSVAGAVAGLLSICLLWPVASDAAQTAAPASDITVDVWNSAPLWDKLDETTADDDTTKATNLIGIAFLKKTQND